MPNETSPELQLIDRWKVIRMLNISESTLERMMIREEDFPLPRRVGPKTIKWLKHEVENYILELPIVDHFCDEHG